MYCTVFVHHGVSFPKWECVFSSCVFKRVSCIFQYAPPSTAVFGRLLRLVSFCSAALLWNCTAENMLSNRAASAAQTWLKQNGQAAVTADY